MDLARAAHHEEHGADAGGEPLEQLDRERCVGEVGGDAVDVEGERADKVRQVRHDGLPRGHLTNAAPGARPRHATDWRSLQAPLAVDTLGQAQDLLNARPRAEREVD